MPGTSANTAETHSRAGTSSSARGRFEERVRGMQRSRHGAVGVERDHLLDRLHNLRTIIPVMAQELASARRELAVLRRENVRLLQRLRELDHSR